MSLREGPGQVRAIGEARPAATPASDQAPLADPRIESERLRLRLYRVDDFPAVRAMSADPAMWTYSERGPMRPDEAWSRLRQGGHFSSDAEIPTRPAGVVADAGPVRYAIGSNGEGRLLLGLRPPEGVKTK